MNAKSKFSIPILSGTRPEVGLFSATVAAPSLRNASNLVSGVAVSSHPIVTTGVTSNNSIIPYESDYTGPATAAVPLLAPPREQGGVRRQRSCAPSLHPSR